MYRRNPLPTGCSYFTDSRGKLRVRFRKSGSKTIYPKGKPGSPEFNMTRSPEGQLQRLRRVDANPVPVR